MHTPVLLSETLSQLNIKPKGQYLDCTGGGGGHAFEIWKHLNEEGTLHICDCHKESFEGLKKKFLSKKNVFVHRERFSLIFDNLALFFDGILADFGVSSEQLDHDKTGISFLQNDLALDMRLDDRLQKTAKDFLRQASETELADIFFHYGGERAARKIARAIVSDRKLKKFYETTTGLRELCERVLGKFYRKKKIHPATKVFQALRIAVNQELEEIKTFLKKAPRTLKKGGRLVAISFHEGEDRLVKTAFKELALTKEFLLPVKKVVRPSFEEIKGNPRARSAKLRVLEKT